MRIPVKRTKKTSQNGNVEQISDQRCSFIHYPGELESLDRNYETPCTLYNIHIMNLYVHKKISPIECFVAVGISKYNSWLSLIRNNHRKKNVFRDLSVYDILLV